MIPLFKVRTNVDQALKSIGEVLESGYVGQGPWVDRFEKKLAETLGVPEWAVLTVNSGTSALQLAMALVGVAGKEVILPPVTCTADPHAVLAMGASIVWADVDPHTGLLDPADVLRRVTPRTAAIIPTDWGGTTPYLAELADLGIPIIQDAAHNFGGRFYGDYVALSFQAIKHLHTADGGCLLVPFNAAKAEEGRLRRWFSLDRRSNADFRCSQNSRFPGYKFHMTDVDAALGLANLPLALESVRLSQQNAAYYQAHLPAQVLVPWDDLSPYWIYTILVDKRDQFMAFMHQKGIATSPVHAICTKHDAFPKASLPGAEAFTARNVAIPNGFWVTPEDRDRIVTAVTEWVR